MHNYKVATCKHVYTEARNSYEVAILAYLERGGLETQRGGPPCSSGSRGNTVYVRNM